MNVPIILSLLAVARAARILCSYPVPVFSHQIVYRALTEELARKQHELVVVTTHPYLPKDRPADNVREIDVFNVSMQIYNKSMFNLSARQTSPVKDFHNIVLRSCLEVFDAQLETPELNELVQNESENFDLIIIACVFRPAFFYTHRFKAPIIGISSLMGTEHNYESTGTPNHPILYPDLFQEKVGNFTFWDKVEAIYMDIWQKYAYWRTTEEENMIGRKHFGDNVADVRVLVNNIDLLFLNVNPVWGELRPASSNVIYVGGLHIKPAKKLPEELQSYLDGCTRGVVYMSLGSNIKSSELPAERLRVFLNAFKDLEYCVLWKWEADNLSGRPRNVRLVKWLPQADLLHHPNVRVFITQGGLQSTDEAIEAEVPLVGIPFIVDQQKNTQKYVLYGIGVAHDINTLSSSVLRESLLKIIENDDYRHNISRLKRLLRDQPMGSLERAAWWTEYLLRHGSAAHLRSPSAGASLADTCALDVLAALAAAALLAACLVAATLRRLRNLITHLSSYWLRS